MSLERQQRLQTFVDWTSAHITGDEKGQAQIFLDRLFQAFGQRGSLDVGGTPEFRIKPGKEDQGGTSFADYVWKPIVLIEMKKRGADLTRHLKQAADYWWNLAPNRPKYTVLCNFDEFWVYDFNLDTHAPQDKLRLNELPARYGPLAFLFPTNEAPVFEVDREQVTRKSARHLAAVFNHMILRKMDRGLAQRFILQLLVALFAKNVGLLDQYLLPNLLAEIHQPKDSFDLIGDLFEAMNRPDGTPGGRYKGVKYFNGGLFKHPARIELDKDEFELSHLREAAKADWSKVSPEIFGELFQKSLGDDESGRDERHAFGAHFTSPVDIMKIIKPTLIDPWTQLIDSATDSKKLLDLLQRLTLLRVLDPACGSGNFLYLAYRELKYLEVHIRDRLRSEFPNVQAPLLHVNAAQFFGLDILPFAVELAKVTLMIARKLAIDELHISDESPLPLANLDANFQCADALLQCSAPPHDFAAIHARDPMPEHTHIATPWPRADVILGNPPFLGAKRLKPERGPDYVNTLRALYPEVPGMADYCVYWFRRAHDHLPVCTPDRPEIGRAGLVGTQNIRNNQSRVGGLDHIVKTGIIVEAVDNQPWSGEANVHVSIANWVKTAPTADPKAPSSAGGPRDGALATTQPAPATDQPLGTRSVSAGHASRSRKGAATIAADQARFLIPKKKKLWFKLDPKLALFSQDRKSRGPAVTTTGKRGKIRQDKSYELDFRETSTINPALSNQLDVTRARVLTANEGYCYTGQYPRHESFMLEPTDAEKMLRAASKSREVVFPFMIGREMLGDGKPSRYVIDFQTRPIFEAKAYALPFAHVEKHTLPYIQELAAKERKKTNKGTGQDQNWLNTWWIHFRPRPELIGKIQNLSRYLVCSRVTKRPVFVFVSSEIRPGDALSCFVFADDYSFGILQSSAHWLWFITKCSKLTERFRYTPESVFDTFPWPQSPTKKQIDAVAAAGREIRRIRTEALAHMTGGLRALYRTLELPGTNPLKSAHSALDSAVLQAYGFSPTEDLLAQLLALNLQVAATIEAGKDVAAPGVPAIYGDPTPLITDDCIRP